MLTQELMLEPPFEQKNYLSERCFHLIAIKQISEKYFEKSILNKLSKY